jgi:Domain of unknown function (DUF4920)
MRRTLFVSLSLALMASGCAQSDAPGSATHAPDPPQSTAAAKGAGDRSGGNERGIQQATATSVKQLEKKKFGAEITEKTAVPLTALVNSSEKYASQTVRTEGTVTAVCQSMGCWMEIGDENGQAHIKMAGHSFFIPAAANGHRAIVQGKVLASPEPNACGGKDGCREKAEAATGRIAKVELEATGVEFVD